MRHKELGIYVHIPFCVRKCAYCDFLSFPAAQEIQQAYFQVLRCEIASFVPAGDYEAVSVYFGGGTPSLPDAGEITQTLDVIRRIFPVRCDAEITIECNPGTMDIRRLAEYRKAGFNRLSIGLQSADDTLLRLLGRIHTWEMFRKEYGHARDAGFENISIDLMYGLPHQTIALWEDTLEKVTKLMPQHVSAYSLIIEEGTPFWERYHEDAGAKKRGEKTLFLPDEETEDAMSGMLECRLRDIGIYRYEISNYAKPGMESRHNTGYWRRREYAGFGLGASGQIGRTRYRNHTALADYLKAGQSHIPSDRFREEVTALTRGDEISETMILGLRMVQGVDLQQFEITFGERAEIIYKDEIERFRQAGLLDISDHYLHLTPRGMDVGNLVMCEFLL